MCPIPYYTMKRQSKDPQYLRFEPARRAKEEGIKPTAKLFDTSAGRGRRGAGRIGFGVRFGVRPCKMRILKTQAKLKDPYSATQSLLYCKA